VSRSPAAEEPGGGAGNGAQLVSCRRIWDAAPHCAFTDLIRFGSEWFCVFREGERHVSPDGAVRVLASSDGERWVSAARLANPRGDLRDPKIVVAPDGKLMLLAAVALKPGSGASHQTLAWFSKDGRDWGEPLDVGEPDFWLWRVTWRGDTAYGVAYATSGEKITRLYRSSDGIHYETVVSRFFDRDYPNESSLVFQPDGSVLCLLRRDAASASAQLGRSNAPYRDWSWKDLGVRIGGPELLRLADGRWIAAVRLYDGDPRTSLAWVDPAEGKLTEFLRLPSGGDTSYAGMQWHEGLLWVSYYSSHESGTAIYLARVRLPE
jgi:hypothetical protein